LDRRLTVCWPPRLSAPGGLINDASESVENVADRLLDLLLVLPPNQKLQAWHKVISKFQCRLPEEFKQRMVDGLRNNTRSSPTPGQCAPSSGPVTRSAERSPSRPMSTQHSIRRRSPGSPASTAARVDEVKAVQMSSRPREADVPVFPSSRERTVSVARASKEEQPAPVSTSSASVPVPRGNGRSRSAGGRGSETRRPERVGTSGHPATRCSSVHAPKVLIEAATRQPRDAPSANASDSGFLRRGRHERSRSKDYQPQHYHPWTQELREFTQQGQASAGSQQEAQQQQRKGAMLKDPKPEALFAHTPLHPHTPSTSGWQSPMLPVSTPIRGRRALSGVLMASWEHRRRSPDVMVPLVGIGALVGKAR